MSGRCGPEAHCCPGVHADRAVAQEKTDALEKMRSELEALQLEADSIEKDKAAAVCIPCTNQYKGEFCQLFGS